MKLQGIGLKGYSYTACTHGDVEWVYGKDMPTLLGVNRQLWQRIVESPFSVIQSFSPSRADEPIVIVIRIPVPQLFEEIKAVAADYATKHGASVVLDLVPPMVASVRFSLLTGSPFALRGRYVPVTEYDQVKYSPDTSKQWRPYALVPAGDGGEMERVADRFVRRREQHLYRFLMSHDRPLSEVIR